MSPRVRFSLWVLCVAVLLPWQTAGLIAIDRFDAPAGRLFLAAIAAAIVALFALLYTTPPNAIRLPVRRSRGCVVIGTAILQATSLVTAGLALTAWPLVAAVVVAATWVLTNVCVRAGRSPWWAVLLAWSPALTLAYRVPDLRFAPALYAIGVAVLAWPGRRRAEST